MQRVKGEGKKRSKEERREEKVRTGEKERG